MAAMCGVVCKFNLHAQIEPLFTYYLHSHQSLVVLSYSQTSPPAGIWPGNETAPWYLMYSMFCSMAWSMYYDLVLV